MQAHYLTLSFSHKNTSITLREKLALPQHRLVPFVKSLRAIPSIKEVLLLSTCNRVEFYLYTHAPQECIVAVLDAFAREIALPLHILESHCHSALGQEAVHHIFSVVSGLDSIVLGETQIVGQMKEAYKLCFELESCAQEMTRLMHFAFRTAAKVRTQTTIAKTPLSIASVAVKKALESSPKSALVLGAGEMAQLAARHLLDSGVAVCMSNRSKNRAINFATTLLQEKKIKQIVHITQESRAGMLKDFGLDSSVLCLLDWQDMPNLFNDFGIIISATSAQELIIRRQMCEFRDMKRAWFDLAVPRDIESTCADLGIEVLCVDDLQQVIEENRSHKKAQAHQAHALVGVAVVEYFHWIQSLDVLPLIKSMREQAKQASVQEVARAIKKGYLQAEQEERVLRILHNAFNVFLHNPTLNLKELSHHKEGDTIIQALQKVFTQNDNLKLLDRNKCEYDDISL